MWRYTHEPKYREWAWEAVQVSRMKDVAGDRIRKIQARKIKIIKNNIKKKIKKKRFAKKYTGLASLRAFYLKNFTVQNNNTKDNKKPK